MQALPTKSIQQPEFGDGAEIGFSPTPRGDVCARDA